MEKAVVIYSGGQDSSTCLFWSLKRFKEVLAIGFDYGQRHLNELRAAERIAQEARVPFEICKIHTLQKFSANALTNNDIAIDAHAQADGPPNTLVEGRNLLFLTYAAIYAKNMGISNLVMGVSQTDYSGYPDCRDAFIHSAGATLKFAFDFTFTIHTPLMFKSKAEIWKLAEDLGVFGLIRDKTVTCYHGIPGAGCGNCPACILRSQGLQGYYDKIIGNERKRT